TVMAATLVAAGKTMAKGCVSASALALTEQAMLRAFWFENKLLLVMMVTLGVAIGGASVTGYFKLLEGAQPAPSGILQTTPIHEGDAGRAKNNLVAGTNQSDAMPDQLASVLLDSQGDPLPRDA